MCSVWDGVSAGGAGRGARRAGRVHVDLGHSSKWGGTVSGDTKTEAGGAGLAAIRDKRLLSRGKAGREALTWESGTPRIHQ